MRVEHDGLADGRDVAQRLRRDGGAVAGAAAEDHDVVGAPDGDLAAQERDHAVIPASARASGARLTWQTATASASAACSEGVSPDRPSSATTMRQTCSFAARPLPHTAPLTCWGV